MVDTTSNRAEARMRIIDGAAALLREAGPAGMTTRAVAERASVQAPTIYRIFGDKDGLLEAVAEHVMATSVAAKAETVRVAADADVDPVAEFRRAWDSQITFGLANPALFRLLSDPERVRRSDAARAGRQVLATRVHRIAQLGLLRVSEHRAVDIVQAAAIGAIQTTLAAPAEERDPGLADAMYDAAMQAILTGPARQASDQPPAPISTVVAFRAIAPELDALSGSERSLLEDWLTRVIRALE